MRRLRKKLSMQGVASREGARRTESALSRFPAKRNAADGLFTKPSVMTWQRIVLCGYGIHAKPIALLLFIPGITVRKGIIEKKFIF